MAGPFTIAILSDIHGNAAALDAVLADLAAVPHDAVVVAGDLVLHGPRPAEALARVRDLVAPTISGNTDHYVLADEVPAGLDLLVGSVRERIGVDGMAYLAGLPFDHRVTPPGGASPGDDLLVVHATPTDVDAVLILEADPFGTWPVTPAEEATALLGDARANLIVFGHIHYASAGTVGASASPRSAPSASRSTATPAPPTRWRPGTGRSGGWRTAGSPTTTGARPRTCCGPAGRSPIPSPDVSPRPVSCHSRDCRCRSLEHRRTGRRPGRSENERGSRCYHGRRVHV